MMAKQEDFHRSEFLAAVALVATTLAAKFYDTPGPIAALAGHPPEPDDGLLTEEEAATELKIHPKTLARYRLAGKIRGETVGARGVRYSREEIARYLSRRKR